MEYAPFIIDFLKTFGVPTAVCAFLLWERRTTMKEFTIALQALRQAIEVLTIALDDSYGWVATEEGKQRLARRG